LALLIMMMMMIIMMMIIVIIIKCMLQIVTWSKFHTAHPKIFSDTSPKEWRKLTERTSRILQL